MQTLAVGISSYDRMASDGIPFRGHVETRRSRDPQPPSSDGEALANQTSVPSPSLPPSVTGRASSSTTMGDSGNQEHPPAGLAAPKEEHSASCITESAAAFKFSTDLPLASGSSAGSTSHSQSQVAGSENLDDAHGEQPAGAHTLEIIPSATQTRSNPIHSPLGPSHPASYPLPASNASTKYDQTSSAASADAAVKLEVRDTGIHSRDTDSRPRSAESSSPSISSTVSSSTTSVSSSSLLSSTAESIATAAEPGLRLPPGINFAAPAVPAAPALAALGAHPQILVGNNSSGISPAQAAALALQSQNPLLTFPGVTFKPAASPHPASSALLNPAAGLFPSLHPSLNPYLYLQNQSVSYRPTEAPPNENSIGASSSGADKTCLTSPNIVAPASAMPPNAAVGPIDLMAYNMALLQRLAAVKNAAPSHYQPSAPAPPGHLALLAAALAFPGGLHPQQLALLQASAMAQYSNLGIPYGLPVASRYAPNNGAALGLASHPMLVSPTISVSPPSSAALRYNPSSHDEISSSRHRSGHQGGGKPQHSKHEPAKSHSLPLPTHASQSRSKISASSGSNQLVGTSTPLYGSQATPSRGGNALQNGSSTAESLLASMASLHSSNSSHLGNNDIPEPAAFSFRNKGATISFTELLSAAEKEAKASASSNNGERVTVLPTIPGPNKSAAAAVISAAANGTAIQTSSHATRISSLADEGLVWDDSLCDTSGRFPAGTLDHPSAEDWFHSWQLNRRVAAKWLSDSDVSSLLFDISKYYACNFEGPFLEFMSPAVPSLNALTTFFRIVEEHSRDSMETEPGLIQVATSYFNCSSRKRAAPECGAKLNTQLWFDLRAKEFFESVEGAKKSNASNLHSAACRACHKSRLPPSVSTLRIVDRLLTAGIPPSTVEEMIRNMAMERCGGVIDDGRFVATSGTIFNRQRKVRVEQSKHLLSPHQTRRKSVSDDGSAPADQASPDHAPQRASTRSRSSRNTNFNTMDIDGPIEAEEEAPQTRRITSVSTSVRKSNSKRTNALPDPQQSDSAATDSDDESAAMEGLCQIRNASNPGSSRESGESDSEVSGDGEWMSKRTGTRKRKATRANEEEEETPKKKPKSH